MGDDGSQNRIYVYMRIRPRNAREKESKLVVNYDMQDPKVLNLDESGKTYGFDGVFYDSVTQKNVFNACVLPILRNVTQGYQSALLCYGQTGSGKTHTMRGKDTPEGDLKGVIPRVAGWLFDKKRDEPNLGMSIALSYIQVYLGKPRDLMNPKNDKVPAFQIIDEELHFINVTEKKFNEYDEFMQYADGAEKYKVVRATAMNPESSRGHSCLVIKVEMNIEGAGGAASKGTGKLFLVDLAGYESAALIGQGTPELVNETKHINETLLGLNRVMSALARKEKHIPYREYNLTLMLKDALSTKTRSTVFCTMSPALEYKGQTMNTIYFGQSAMSVKVSATLAVVSDWKSFAQQMQKTCAEREDRIRTLKAWFETVSKKEMDLYNEKFGEVAEDEYDEGTTDLEDLYDAFKDTHGGKMVSENVGSAGGDYEFAGVDDADLENITDERMLAKIKAKLDHKLKFSEEAFEKEMEDLKVYQAREIESMAKEGFSEKEIAAIKREHQWEIDHRTSMHLEAKSFLQERKASAKVTTSFGATMKIFTMAKSFKLRQTAAGKDILQELTVAAPSVSFAQGDRKSVV